MSDKHSSNGANLVKGDDHLYHLVHPWERLKDLLRADSNELWVAVLYSLAIGLVSLVLPVAVQALVNTVAFGTVLQPIVVLTALVFLALCFSTVLTAYRHWVVELIQRRMFVRMAGNVTAKLVNVDPQGFDRYHGPELVNRFLDVATIQKASAGLLLDGLSVFTQSAIGMVLLAVYHPWLLAFDFMLLLSIAIVLFPMGRGAIPTSVKESKAKYALLAWLEEIARHQISFRTRFGARLAVERTNSLVVDYLTYRSKHYRILMRQVVGSHALQAFASATLLGVGGWLVVQRQLTLGQLVAAEIVVALVVSSFTKFGKHLESFYDLMAALDKLGYLTDLPVERTSGDQLFAREGPARIRIAGVNVLGSNRGVLLRDVDVEFPEGSRTGIIGNTGSGKSTLLDLIYGLRVPETGYVEFNGRDYREVLLGDLRERISLVREPEIFEATLFENLRLGLDTCTSESAREVLERVGLLGSVLDLPQGLNTPLQTGGLPLSPGQRVQLVLARALLRRPKLLILDESLDWLDDLPEREVLLDTLFSPNAPWTLIVVSQSPDILSRCERVYEVKDRTVQEAQPGARV